MYVRVFILCSDGRFSFILLAVCSKFGKILHLCARPALWHVFDFVFYSDFDAVTRFGCYSKVQNVIRLIISQMYVSVFVVALCLLRFLFLPRQNFFGDAWNVLDFIIVVGSLVDIAASKLAVSGNKW